MEKMDAGDLIQLAAYVVFFLIIAGASVVRKLLEAKKKRQEQERRQGRSRPVIGRPHTLSPAGQPVVVKPIADEVPAPPPAPHIDLEDIFRKAFGIPDDSPKQQPKLNPVKIRQQTPKPVQNYEPIPKPPSPSDIPASERADIYSPQKTTAQKEPEFSWQGFMDTLDERGLTGVQKAIILTEVFNKPSALRRFKK